MLKLGLFVAAMFLIQAVLTSVQISHFNQEAAGKSRLRAAVGRLSRRVCRDVPD